MNSRTQFTTRKLAIGAGIIAITFAMAGCNGPSDSGSSGSSIPPQSSTESGAPSGPTAALAPSLASVTASADPSLPAASTVWPPSAAAAAPRGAQASDPAIEPMSKHQETTKMPMPGQVNDYSTVVKDGKK